MPNQQLRKLLFSLANSIQRYGLLMKKILSCGRKVGKVLMMLPLDFQKLWQPWSQNFWGNYQIHHSFVTPITSMFAASIQQYQYSVYLCAGSSAPLPSPLVMLLAVSRLWLFQNPWSNNQSSAICVANQQINQESTNWQKCPRNHFKIRVFVQIGPSRLD